MAFKFARGSLETNLEPNGQKARILDKRLKVTHVMATKYIEIGCLSHENSLGDIG